jgi:hypothetical protein
VTAINLAWDYCSPLADACSLAYNWPTASYAWQSSDQILSVTTQTGSVARFTMDAHKRVTAVKPANSATDKIFYQYCARVAPFNCSTYVSTGGGPTGPQMSMVTIKDRVLQVTADGQAWNYSFPQGTYGPYYLPYRSNGPEGRQSMALVTISGAGALITYGRNGPDALTAEYQNTAYNRITKAKAFGKREEVYVYDGRANVTSNGLTTAGFDVTCSNILTCNRPNWVRDPAGNQTDYVFSPVHGGLVSATAPVVNGIRPQTRYEYVQRSPWVRSTSSGWVQVAPAIWVKSAESFCRTSAATGNPVAPCAIAGDEVRTLYEYGPDAGPNNLVVRGIAVTADRQTRRTCLGYDRHLRKISETLPAGTAVSCP